jgi:pullulanase
MSDTATKENKSEIISTKQLGSIVTNGKTTFRLFAPNANSVKLYIFDAPEYDAVSEQSMKIDDNGVWEITLNENLTNKFYGYKVAHSETDDFKDLPLCVDPYSKAVTSFTDYNNPRKSIVDNESYD